MEGQHTQTVPMFSPAMMPGFIDQAAAMAQWQEMNWQVSQPTWWGCGKKGNDLVKIPRSGARVAERARARGCLQTSAQHSVPAYEQCMHIRLGHIHCTLQGTALGLPKPRSTSGAATPQSLRSSVRLPALIYFAALVTLRPQLEFVSKIGALFQQLTQKFVPGNFCLCQVRYVHARALDPFVGWALAVWPPSEAPSRPVCT